MKLLFLRKMPTETALIVFFFAVGLIGLPYLPIGEALAGDDPVAAEAVGLAIVRGVCFFAALAASFALGFSSSHAPSASPTAFLCLIPALLVCVNNLPIIALARGTAYVVSPERTILLFALECFAVAAFEETVFRGTVFPLFLQTFGTGKRGRFEAVALSSAMFGALHLVNLFAGASVGATVLQVGYSALIGAMLCVVLFTGGSLPLCIALHAVYNFGGLLIPTCGVGSFADVWNVPTIVISALLGVATFVSLAYVLWRADDASALRRHTLPPAVRFRRVTIA